MSRSGLSVTTRLKRRLKPMYASGQRALARTLFAYSPAELEAAVRRLGIGDGDTLFAHSGFHRANGFRGTAGDVIDCLLGLIGPQGNLLMMSMPYRGSSERYAEADPVFDVQRTPSAVGLISEVFRRRDGVLRSLSPLHPVTAYGPLAAWLVADHERCAYSCGRGSPFERFLALNGKFLFFDAPYASLTFMHHVEDLFRERLPVPLYEPRPFSLRVRTVGRELKVRQFVFSRAARARRNFGVVDERLRRLALLRSTRIGNTRLLGVAARSVLECARQVVEEGQGFYR